jgi:excinuclease ABC subunit A
LGSCMSDIVVRGAREHNLDDVHLRLPRNKFICFTGVSGSGKSSLAFDTLYAEGQRRYIESLSSYARQFLGQLPRPAVDQVLGLSPAISISQKTGGQNVRSTVGTITEISDFLRVLFARVAVGYCPKCGRKIVAQTRAQILERLRIIPEGVSFQILAPLVRNQKGRCVELFNNLRKKGYRKVRVDGRFYSVDDEINLDRQARHSVDVVVDRIKQSESTYRLLTEALDAALKLGKGQLIVLCESSVSDVELRARGKNKKDAGELFDVNLVSEQDLETTFDFSNVSDEFQGTSLEKSVKDARQVVEGSARVDDDAGNVDSLDSSLITSSESHSRQEVGTESEESVKKDSSTDVSLQSESVEDLEAFKHIWAGKELYFSEDYTCSHCGLSFERPTPQMFSFNNVQGMCQHCQGLGVIHTFDPALLIPDPTKSFQQGCIVPIGKWQDLGRWKQHIYQGVMDALEKKYSLSKGYVLETPWNKLDERVKQGLLWGTDELKITYSWRDGGNGHKWVGLFEGIIPKMLKQYRETNNKMQLSAMESYMNVVLCGYCHGARLNEQARAFRLETKSEATLFSKKKIYSLPELCKLSISDLLEFFSELKLTDSERIIARDLLKEIRGRLGFLLDVGLNYLSLGRSAPTLSGGEMQRIRLAGQIGGGLVGVMYVLDEPSIGLHPRDNERLIQTLLKLRDLGNTVLVVEHDEDTMLAADYLVDFGPGPGAHGGRVVASGSVYDVLANQSENSLTAKYLIGEESIEMPVERKKPDGRWLKVCGVTHHNLKNVDIKIPLGGVVCITGVSGSGKSSFVNDVLKEVLARELNRANGNPGAFKSIDGVEHLNKLISIDQAPIGRTPRSNPATYIKLFDEIRKLFSETPEARAKGFTPGRFSFNVAGGRCEACEGNGSTRLEMDFLADVWATCSICGGRRFNQETTAIKYKGLSIDQVLALDVETALKHFENIPKIREKLQTLYDVGLGYMKLGQPSPTLSGGEAQRVKLAKELVKKSSGKTMYLLDEPTTGLHFADVRLLLKVLHSFAEAGNTVLIVEHNLDVIKTADWVIDLGPEGGDAGGWIVAEGTPEMIMDNPRSHTGKALRDFLNRDRKALVKQVQQRDVQRDTGIIGSDVEGPIIIRGACEHNLQNISVEIPRNKTTVCCGPSGSGKSSLAIDVAYAEGRRRYVESLSSYARQFLGQIQKPKVEKTIGISPSIAIEQKTTSRSPRSTVGTVTEIQDYLRIVFARLGVPYCPSCDCPIGTQSTDEIVARIMLQDLDARALLTAPLRLEPGEDYDKLWQRLRIQGFSRVRVNDETYSLDSPPELSRKSISNVEVVVDRLRLKKNQDENLERNRRSRVADSVETALEWGKGVVRLVIADDTRPERDWIVQTMSQKKSCEKCGRAFEVLTPRHFSFNSQLGWCPHCEGLGVHAGANPLSFIRDPKLTLAEGAITLWSDLESPVTVAMMRALARETGTPLDVSFERLDSRFRRIIFNGTGERWINVLECDLEIAQKAQNAYERARGACDGVEIGSSKVVFQYQYKGVYPATEEAGRGAPYYRRRLEYQVEEQECSVCLGSRLRDDVSAVRFHDLTLDQICRTPLRELVVFFEQLSLSQIEKEIASDLIDEIIVRLHFLLDVGLDYLTLSRPAPSLSGGEAQRIRLAAQIGSGLVGVLYVLDEPTIGLHCRDNKRLIAAMKKLRDLGNTLLIVEHDKDVIESADNIIDFGPHAGAQGGLVVASGTPEEIKQSSKSVTGPYISGEKSIPIPINRRIVV